MRKRNLFMMVAAVSLSLIFRLTTNNVAQELPPMEIRIGNDITAWQEMVFVLDQATLLKLNSQLNVVKSVELPLSPTPLVPAFQSDRSMFFAVGEANVLSAVEPVDAAIEGSVCADLQNVYVLYNGTLFVYDHDLNHQKSKILDSVQ
jgi:hypothetical protein